MLTEGFYNLDCMEALPEYPDNYFDLAIVDPPYGINICSNSNGAGGVSRRIKTATQNSQKKNKYRRG